tara:strand:- start:1491 stop:1604 length:114 start_codon:yes stop_codon:yes gene_type:complete
MSALEGYSLSQGNKKAGGRKGPLLKEEMNDLMRQYPD